MICYAFWYAFLFTVVVKSACLSHTSALVSLNQSAHSPLSALIVNKESPRTSEILIRGCLAPITMPLMPPFTPDSDVWCEHCRWWFSSEALALCRNDCFSVYFCFYYRSPPSPYCPTSFWKNATEGHVKAWRERTLRYIGCLSSCLVKNRRENGNNEKWQWNSNQQSLFIPGLDPAVWHPTGSYFACVHPLLFCVWLLICTLCCWSSQHVPLLLLLYGSRGLQCHSHLSSQQFYFSSRFLV